MDNPKKKAVFYVTDSSIKRIMNDLAARGIPIFMSNADAIDRRDAMRPAFPDEKAFSITVEEVTSKKAFKQKMKTTTPKAITVK